MSEQYPTTTPQAPEIALPHGQEVELHNQSVQLPKGQVLHDLEATRAQGFNGVTVTEIVLPIPVAPGSDIDKRVALIDFGEDAETSGKAVLYYPPAKKEQAHLGVIRTRYGLVTLNYHPEDRLAGVVPLKTGHSETIGRNEDNRNNYLLDLLDKDVNQELSRTHATIALDENGAITIEDHSTNGTRVVMPTTQ